MPRTRQAGPSRAPSGSASPRMHFFHLPDGLLAAVEAGATAVIQPGGSIRDDEVIQAADDAGLAIVFTAPCGISGTKSEREN